MHIAAGHRALLALASAEPLSSLSASGPGLLPAPRAVVIGNFDGVHRGHQALFTRARALCGAAGSVVALTFDPHPARLFAPDRAPPLIATRTRKRELLQGAGVDLVVEEPFDRAFSALSPLSFVEEVLLRGLGARYVCVGYDFTFGKGRAGGTEMLGELLAARGAEVVIVPAQTVPDPDAADASDAARIVCSSTFVRQEVRAGRPDRASRVLGRDPEVEGTIVHGAGRGRTIGVPTANMRPATELLPATGVYAAWAEILEDEPDGTDHDAMSHHDAMHHDAAATAHPPGSPLPLSGGAGRAGRAGEIVQFRPRRVAARHPAAVNVGYNPTFVENRGDAALPPVSIETHLIRTAGSPPFPELYGKRMRIALRARLRAEQKFPSVSALVQQIHGDIDAAAVLLGVLRARE